MYINDAFTSLTAINKEHKLQRDTHDQEILKIAFDVLHGDGKYKGTLLSRDSSGNLLYLDTSVTSYGENEHKLVLIQVNDITTAVQSEKEKNNYREIFYNSPLGMYQTTPDGRILKANPAIIKMLGFGSFEELVKRNLEVEGYSNQDDAREIFKQKLEAAGELTGYENTWLTNDGKKIYVRENAKLIKQKDGSVVYEGTVEDITEKVLAEQALKESEERFRILFEGNPDPVILANPATHQIIDSNKAACALLKCTKDQLKGKHITDLAVPELKQKTLKNLEIQIARADAGEKITINYTFLNTFENESIPVEIIAQLITLNGEKILYGVIRDLSERRKTEKAENKLRISEQELRQKEKLLKTIIANIPLGVMVVNEKGETFLSNDAFEKIWGGRPYSDLKNHYNYKGWWHNSGESIGHNDWGLARAITKGETSLNEIIRIECFDGKKKVVQNAAVPIHSDDAEPKVIGAVGVLQDITELIEIQNQLAQSEKRFRTLIQNSSDVIMLLDPLGIITYLSPSVENITGFTIEEQINTEAFNWMHPEDYTQIVRLFDELLTKPGTPIRMELRILLKTGEWIWAEAIAINLLQDPAVSSIIVNYRDINERKLAELELQKTEERFRTSVETMLDSFAILEAKRNDEGTITDFTFKYINEAGCKSTLYKREEILNLGLLQALPMHKQNGLFEEYCRIVETGKPLIKDAMLYEDYVHGKILSRYLEINAVKLGDGIAAAWRDISSRKQAESRQRISESRYRALASNLPDSAVFLFDRDLRYVLVEGSEITKLGIPKEVMEGKTVTELFPEEITSVVIPYYNAALEGRQSVFEIGSDENFYEVRTLPIKNEAGDIVAGMALVVNITERKRVEKELKELNASKDKFFSIIAHDLRSPFTSLLGLSEFLANDFDSLSSEDVKNFSLNIYKSAKSVFDLVDNLLQWSRFKTGAVEYLPKQFPLNELIEQALSVYHVSFVKKNITVVNSADRNIQVFADAYMIDTVIRNILSNAIKFTHHGGEINISAETTGRITTVIISDNGVGISEENMAKLLDLGERITTLGTNNEKGTGLGVILCKEFIEKNKGTMTIESKVGEGTVITITLPAIQGSGQL